MISDCLSCNDAGHLVISGCDTVDLARQYGTPLYGERLLQLARDAFVPTSQQEIRSILAQMADQGLVRVSRGRGGSQLTPEGRQLYETGRI